MMFNVYDNLKDKTVDELKEIAQKDRLPFAVCFLNLEHDLNIGNGIRSAHIFGASKVIVFGKNKVDTRSTVGAHNYVNYIKYNFNDYDNEDLMVKEFIKMCQENKVYPIFIDKLDNSKNLENSEFIFKEWKNHKHLENITPCLIFGNENAGIPQSLIEKTSNEVYHLEQRGVIRSLNVASAAAVAMYQVSKYLTY